MPFLSSLISLAAPLFLILSPITSYLDQILSMHRSRSSAGFSLDIPLIMLTASILKIYYYPGARFDVSLLVQAIVMLFMQAVLLKVALDNRPSSSVLAGREFEMRITSDGLGNGGVKGMETPTWAPKKVSTRPGDFWRWREQEPYWKYVLGLAISLGVLHILIRPAPGRADNYTTLLGAFGLGIEALLPLPQLWQNYNSQSCKGFRLSVIANWLFGDAMKMGFFFLSDASAIPWSFKACGIFQALCDLGLGFQFWMYGEGHEFDEEHYA